MYLPKHFRLRQGYFLLGAFIGAVSLFFQVKPVKAFSFPSIADIPSLTRLIPFANILPLNPLPTLKPFQSFQNPFASPTPTPTVTPSLTSTPTPTPSDTPTPTLTPIPTLTPVPTETPTLTPTLTPIPTETPTPTLTPIPTETPVSTETPTPTITPSEIPSPSAAPDHMLINEVFPGGLSTIEWIELFNSTSDPIDVSGWNIFDNSTNDTLPLSAPIGAGNYAVIVGSGSTVAVPVSAVRIELSSAIGGGLSVSGDRIEMKNTANITVDAVSWGSDNTFFSSPPSAPASGESLSRLPNGFDTDAASDWSSGFSPSAGIAN